MWSMFLWSYIILGIITFIMGWKFRTWWGRKFRDEAKK